MGLLMSNVWDRFESIANTEEVNNAKAQFTPIASGEYTCVLEEIMPSESKSGLPMIKGKFRTTENKVIFYNQTLQNLNNPNMTAVNIADALTFVGALLDQDVEFEGLGAFANLITTIPVGIKYIIQVSYGKNDFEMKFPKLKVVNRVGEEEYVLPVGDDEIPF